MWFNFRNPFYDNSDTIEIFYDILYEANHYNGYRCNSDAWSLHDHIEGKLVNHDANKICQGINIPWNFSKWSN